MMGNIVAAGLLHPAKQALMKLKPDVLCVPFLYPPFYALAEVLNIPVVGIGWGTPSFLTQQASPLNVHAAPDSLLCVRACVRACARVRACVRCDVCARACARASCVPT